MFEFEEKSPHKVPVLLPNRKNGSSDDMEDDKVGQEEAAEGVVGKQTKEDSEKKKRLTRHH